jgi:hypothetical protein
MRFCVIYPTFICHIGSSVFQMCRRSPERRLPLVCSLNCTAIRCDPTSIQMCRRSPERRLPLVCSLNCTAIRCDPTSIQMCRRSPERRLPLVCSLITLVVLLFLYYYLLLLTTATTCASMHKRHGACIDAEQLDARAIRLALHRQDDAGPLGSEVGRLVGGFRDEPPARGELVGK